MRLERAGSLGWTIAWVPFEVFKVWGTRGQLRVIAETGGEPYPTVLFPRGDGRHFMMVNKKMQKCARIRAGMEVTFRLRPDAAPRTARTPVELEKLFKKEPGIRRWFEKNLNSSTRREIGRWIAEGKHAETRQRRVEQMAERILATMEAERKLPPLFRSAFAANPKARAGWERMSPSHRRMQLLAVYYYRTPESQARRIAKMVAEAAELGQRREAKDR